MTTPSARTAAWPAPTAATPPARSTSSSTPAASASPSSRTASGGTTCSSAAASSATSTPAPPSQSSSSPTTSACRSRPSTSPAPSPGTPRRSPTASSAAPSTPPTTPASATPGQWQDHIQAEADCVGALCTFPGPLERSFSLYENGYRWYRPDLGRYTQADPLGLRGGAHLLLYVQGNPARFTDSLGLMVSKFIGCTAGDEIKIQRAAAEADAAMNHHCSCTIDREEFRSTVRDLTVKCLNWPDDRYPDPIFPKSGPLAAPRACGSVSDYDPKSKGLVRIGAKALGLTRSGIDEGQGCGCLQATIMHEILHLIGLDHQIDRDARWRAG